MSTSNNISSKSRVTKGVPTYMVAAVLETTLEPVLANVLVGNKGLLLVGAGVHDGWLHWWKGHA